MCISLYVSESWSVGENDSRLGNVCVREKEREKKKRQLPRDTLPVYHIDFWQMT